MIASALPVAASPSRVWLILCAFLLLPAGLFASLPMLLLLASIFRLVETLPDLELIFLALPAAVFAVFCFTAATTFVRDLLLRRPVLTLDERAIFDRRITDEPIPWTAVADATALSGGRGGVLLTLSRPITARLNPYRIGSAGLRLVAPGLVHIPLRALTLPSALLSRTILELAARHGAITTDATKHDGLSQTMFQ